MRPLTWLKGQSTKVKAFLLATDSTSPRSQPTAAGADRPAQHPGDIDRDSQVTLCHHLEAGGAAFRGGGGLLRHEQGDAGEPAARQSVLGPAILLTPATPSEELGQIDLEDESDECDGDEENFASEEEEQEQSTEIQNEEGTIQTETSSPMQRHNDDESIAGPQNAAGDGESSSTAQDYHNDGSTVQPNESTLSAGPPSATKPASQDDAKAQTDAISPSTPPQQDTDQQHPTTVRLKKELWKIREQRDEFHRQLTQCHVEMNKRRNDILLLQRNRKQEIEHSLAELQQSLTAKMETLQHEMADVKTQCGVLGLQVNQLTSTLDDRNDKIKRLDQDLQGSQVAREALVDALNKKSVQLAALEADLDAHRIALADREEKVAHLNAFLGGGFADAAADDGRSVQLLSQLRERMQNIFKRMETWRQKANRCVTECQEIVAALNALLDEVQREE
ncbi:hypothetical protein HDU86_006097 [Geranomyces michiganensis]|nr:hypothetical protein HDU86_006097 [Geranomyces michiganensis]